jgi:hypothetical protein
MIKIYKIEVNTSYVGTDEYYLVKESEFDIENYANELAYENYLTYELNDRSIADIMYDDGVDENEAEDIREEHIRDSIEFKYEEYHYGMDISMCNKIGITDEDLKS